MSLPPRVTHPRAQRLARASRPFDLAVLGPHDDDLGDRLPGDLLREALGDDPVGLLRLGLPRDLGLALEREEHRHAVNDAR